MPTNGNSVTPPSTLPENEAAPTTKKTRTKSVKTARRPASSASARSAATRSAEPSEILFEDVPNPYHEPVPPYIWIDHPEERERLLAPVYVVRLGVGGAEQVEIAIDNGPWQPCRLTSGYWWFDWSKIQPGRHTLVARMRTADGRAFRTPPRACDYRL